jgi:hypothetical protein
MEQGSLNQPRSQRESLEDLPETQSKFWEGAEVHTGIVPHDFKPESGHSFVRKSGREAYCEGCNWGFALDPGDKIIEGHLYNRNKEFVI